MAGYDDNSWMQTLKRLGLPANEYAAAKLLLVGKDAAFRKVMLGDDDESNKNVILQALGTFGTRPVKQVDIMAAFYNKLQEYDTHIQIDRIPDGVKKRLMQYFFPQIEAVTQPSVDPSFAHELYLDARRLPGTNTKVVMRDELSLAINGPIFEGTSFILSAVDCSTGQLLALKLLPTHEKRYTDAAATEKRAVRSLQLAGYFERYLGGRGSVVKADIPLMPTKLVKVEVCDYPSAQALGVGKQTHEALVMPMMGSSLARLPQLPEELLDRGGRRLQSALKHMHEAGLVKSDNCMVSETGDWYLGDFGSSLPIGDKIAYATDPWHPERITGTMADPRHDWMLLVVLLAVELDKAALSEVTTDIGGSQRVDKALILLRCKAAKEPKLKALLEELIQDAWPDMKLT